MLHPRKVGIVDWRRAEFPASVFAQQVAGPIAGVKGRVSKDEVGFEIGMGVFQKRTFVIPSDIGSVNAPNGEVHLAQTPGGMIPFLPIDGYISYASAMCLNELLRLDEHAS